MNSSVYARLCAFCIIVVCIINFAVAQQTSVVQGTVKHADTHLPIAGALVYIQHTEFSALTSAEGEFSFAHVPMGRYVVEVSSLGYTPYRSQSILVQTAKHTDLMVYLEEQSVELPSIVIRPRIEKEEALNPTALVSSRMFSSEEASRYAGSWGDPARMVSNFAGVASANDARNDIIVRGNSPMGLLWLVDGHEIPNPNHFATLTGTGGPLGMINNNLLSNSDFYTGAFPAEYGNVLAGIFDVKLKQGNSSSYKGIGSLGFNGIELGGEGPLPNLQGASFMINGRYSFVKLLSFMDFAGTQGAVPHYKDANAKIYIPFKNSSLSIVSIVGGSSILLDPQISAEDWKENTFKTIIDSRGSQYFAGANYTYRGKNLWRWEQKLSYLSFNVHNDLNNYNYSAPDIAEPYFSEHNNDGKLSYSSRWYKRFSAAYTAHAGIGSDVFLTNLKETAYTQSAPIELRSKNTHTLLYKAYTLLHYKPSAQWQYTPGIYSQLWSYNNTYSVEPRMAIKYKLSERADVSLGVGLHAMLQPKQLYFYIDEQGNLPNKNIDMSKSWHTVLGYNRLIRNNWRIKSELYYQYLYDIPVSPLQPAESILNLGDDHYTNWDLPFENSGTGKNYGAECTIEKFLSDNFYVLITAALYNSTYTALDNKERHTKFSGNYALHALGGYEWVVRKSTHDIVAIHLKSSYMGNKRILPTAYDNIAFEHVGGSNPVYDYTNAYTTRLPDYVRFDLRIAHTQNLKRIAIESFFEVINITNHKNIYSQYYMASKQQYAYTYQNGLTPMGGCKVYF